MNENDIFEEGFDPTLPTDRTPASEWDQPMDEADAYVDWDDVSDADADWRDNEPMDLWDDEQAFGSAGFGMDESYDY